jgi:hypothetical protein
VSFQSRTTSPVQWRATSPDEKSPDERPLDEAAAADVTARVSTP